MKMRVRNFNEFLPFFLLCICEWIPYHFYEISEAFALLLWIVYCQQFISAMNKLGKNVHSLVLVCRIDNLTGELNFRIKFHAQKQFLNFHISLNRTATTTIRWLWWGWASTVIDFQQHDDRFLFFIEASVLLCVKKDDTLTTTMIWQMATGWTTLSLVWPNPSIEAHTKLLKRFQNR